EDITGVVWAVQLMAVKVLCRIDGDVPTGNVGDAIAGIEYAIPRGASILNLSWDLPTRNKVLEGVLRDASALFIVAAGNEKSDIDMDPVYPAAYVLANVIAVAAT